MNPHCVHRLAAVDCRCHKLGTEVDICAVELQRLPRHEQEHYVRVFRTEDLGDEVGNY